MRLRKSFLYLILAALVSNACQATDPVKRAPDKQKAPQSPKKEVEEAPAKPKTAQDIILEKELSYSKHSLEDSYSYKDTTRSFQWDKIKEKLAIIENFAEPDIQYAVLRNYKNLQKEAPLVKKFSRNVYTRIIDSLGVERYQSVPLYDMSDDSAPILYGRDGSLVKVFSTDSSAMVPIQGLSFEGKWQVPQRYIKRLEKNISFDHIICVDVKNQNICTLEKSTKGWIIRSMNPATTGQHKPPHAQETPPGIFVVQERKAKMFYFSDGTKEIGGFAPWASRFTNGAYIHGIPVNKPHNDIVEFSTSLGTIPRSHMCVRNASSHAKFIYDWAKPLQSLVLVID